MTNWTLVGKAALVVVHMQNAICTSPSPPDFMGHQCATAQDGTISHVADLLEAFRSRHLPVISIVAVHPGEPEIPAYGAFWQGLPGSQVNQLGSPVVEVVDELSLIVPSDCVTDGNRQLHEAIMTGIMPVISLVTTSADVIARL